MLSLGGAVAARIERAFSEGQDAGLIHLATVEMKTALPPALGFARDFAQRYVTRLCHLGELAPDSGEVLLEPPQEDVLGALALEAPPMKGLEYLDAGTLRAAWSEIDFRVRSEAAASGQSPRTWLHERNPLWRLVGRVTFHLAENKRDEAYPFACAAAAGERQCRRKPAASLGAAALLDFSVSLTLDGAPLTDAEREELLASSAGLVRLRGQWVEVDGEKLAAALAHWKNVEKDARAGGLSFYVGMRLLAGAADGGRALPELPEPLREWSGIAAGEWLRELLAGPGLGACLADDMGLGKTLQVIALLLHLRSREARGSASQARVASLIVAPASLLANWKSEIERFAPSLMVFVAHPSENATDLDSPRDLATALAGVDVALTNRLSDLWSLFDFLNPGLPARRCAHVRERGQAQAQGDRSLLCAPSQARAAMYGVGARFDHQPELLFALRKVDHGDLIAAATDVGVSRRRSQRKTLASEGLGGIFGIELAEAPCARPAPAKRPVRKAGEATKAKGRSGQAASRR